MPPQISKQVEQRPEGVTILAILEIIVGIVALVVGLFSLWSFPGIEPSIFFAIGGVISVLIGMISFVIAYGFLRGRGWAWTVGLIFAIMGIAWGLISLGRYGVSHPYIINFIMHYILDAPIIYYLTRPSVKRFFGNARYRDYINSA